MYKFSLESPHASVSWDSGGAPAWRGPARRGRVRGRGHEGQLRGARSYVGFPHHDSQAPTRLF